MQNSLLVLLLSLVAVSLATIDVTVTSVTDNSNEEFRTLTVVRDTLTNTIDVSGAKVQVTPTGQFMGNVALDAGSFRMQAGDPTGTSPGVGFSELSATANYQYTPGTGASASINGAYAEILFGLSHIFLYENRDGVAGFQYVLGSNIWGCSGSGSFDCVIANSLIPLSSLYYSPITVNNVSCPSGGAYSTNCTVWEFTTKGYNGILGVGAQVIQVNQYIANQKVETQPTVTSNGVTHSVGPDYTKIDIIINYPYSTQVPSNAGSIGLATFVAGTAGTFAGRAATFNGQSAFAFQGSSGKVAFLSWDGTAVLDNIVSTVYANGLSGQAIINYDCTTASGCDLTSQVVLGVWKATAQALQNVGWASEWLFLSTSAIGTNSWVYDPTGGSVDSGNGQLTWTNSVGFLAPSLYLCFFWFVAVFFYSKV